MGFNSGFKGLIKINSTTTLQSLIQRRNGLCPPDVSIKRPIRISLLSRWGHIICPPQPTCLVHPRYIWRGAQTIQPLIMQFLQGPASLSHQGTNIFLSTLQTERQSSR